jgi:hypothetical protein
MREIRQSVIAAFYEKQQLHLLIVRVFARTPSLLMGFELGSQRTESRAANFLDEVALPLSRNSVEGTDEQRGLAGTLISRAAVLVAPSAAGDELG